MTPLDFQKPALAEITARARAYFRGDWRELPIQPRWATIIAAGTGVGKTTTATMVSTAVGASLCRVSAPSYIPSGAHNRSTKETIGVIAQHVAQNDRTILFVDELDKISDETPWQGYCRNELYDLIGGNWPNGMNLPELDKGPDPTIEELTHKLRTTVFFLAAGTFQQWFDEATTRRTMGFMADEQENEEITADSIAQKLPRELINRFGKIVRLPELRENDYRQIALEAERKLPQRFRESFRVEAAERIPQAIREKKGVRYIEEALTAVLLNQPEPTCMTLDDL
jgi:SpoVK/Ycf46/Vps4 family AAA+-type ATPase